MLIFGGITARSIYYKDNVGIGANYDLYTNCEKYFDLTGKDPTLNKTISTCGEEILNDIWIYGLTTGVWTYIKVGTNLDFQLYPNIPPARYGHSGSYVALNDLNNVYPGTNVPIQRKYLYIYGGYSFQCETACYDLWRYEIAFGPYSFYPKTNTGWQNAGNHWLLVNNDLSYNPGPRYMHSQISHLSNLTAVYGTETKNRTEQYLYIFGGVLIRNIENTTSGESSYNSSFLYMGDLWRFDLINSQWENMEVFGIATVRRTLSLWNGTIIERTVPPD